jgi:hypothetical protein
MLSVLNIYNQEIEKNKQVYADEGEEGNLDATMNRINNGDDRDKEMHKTLRTSALVLLEQNFTDKSTDPVGAIEGLLKTIRVSQNAQQQARLSLVSGVENNHMENEDFETRESSFQNLVTDWFPHH